MNVLDLTVIHQLLVEHLEQLIRLSEEEMILSVDARAYVNREISSLTQKLSLLDAELARSKSRKMEELSVRLHLQNLLYLVQSGEYPIKEIH